jgi:hypothetical protein
MWWALNIYQVFVTDPKPYEIRSRSANLYTEKFGFSSTDFEKFTIVIMRDQV